MWIIEYHLFRHRLENNIEFMLGLYNALNGSHYTNEEELELVTLENAIYMSMKNDLAFILDSRLALYEHQSTPNPNMPLRDLFYVSKQYEKLVSTRTLYSTRSVKIPAPHFIVFYNGVDKQPEKKTLKLSELYQMQEEEPMLELKVTMLNITDGNNEELKESCQVLKEYMQYVNRVRKYIQKGKLECICKKLRKGKDAKIIAEELEEELENIERICEIARQFAPEYDAEIILEEEQKQK